MLWKYQLTKGAIFGNLKGSKTYQNMENIKYVECVNKCTSGRVLGKLLEGFFGKTCENVSIGVPKIIYRKVSRIEFETNYLNNTKKNCVSNYIENGKKTSQIL